MHSKYLMKCYVPNGEFKLYKMEMHLFYQIVWPYFFCFQLKYTGLKNKPQRSLYFLSQTLALENICLHIFYRSSDDHL